MAANDDAQLRQKFQEFDKDGNGSITYDEAYAVFSKELGFSEQKTRRFLALYDVDNDGKLSYEEFLPFYNNMKKKKADLEKIFHQIDKDGSGAISLDEARGALQGVFSEKELKCLFELHDTNKDGSLQYEEFVKFWEN